MTMASDLSAQSDNYWSWKVNTPFTRFRRNTVYHPTFTKTVNKTIEEEAKAIIFV